ncbi:MAG: hypothetical protein A3H28_12635 [Acidobacteria bacterium RIFCSPLOWO2_02_FULL_61_28]|nr:MAG: hypothetical protein A3H28_12635 [Acidobacteria bacterium RIFCSPLOWO2_02_FULL_61_28]
MRDRELRKLVEATSGELKGKTKPQIIAYLRKCVVDQEFHARRAEIEGVRRRVAQLMLRDKRSERCGSATVSNSEEAAKAVREAQSLLDHGNLTEDEEQMARLKLKLASTCDPKKAAKLVQEIEKIKSRMVSPQAPRVLQGQLCVGE